MHIILQFVIRNQNRCESLKWLDVQNTPVSDITSLKSCQQLEFLLLSDTNVTDISPLAQCRSLSRLHLQRTAVSDVSTIYMRCPNLREVHIDDTPITNPEVGEGVQIIGVPANHATFFQENQNQNLHDNDENIQNQNTNDNVNLNN